MISTARLSGCRLRVEMLAGLAPRISAMDRLECEAHHGKSVGEALLDGLHLGIAFAATWDNEVIGAFGVTEAGHIWSLWTNLTSSQQRAILRRTCSVVSALRTEAGKPLWNQVRADNHLTIRWLKASRCFEFTDQTVEVDGVTYLPFYVKPLVKGDR